MSSPDDEMSPPSQNEANILDDIFANVHMLLIEYGWTIIFLLILAYILSPYVQEFQKNRSLSIANSPSRRATFEEDVKRARARQQLDVYKSAREHKEEEKAKPPKKIAAPVEPKKKADFSLLGGQQGMSSYRPTNTQRQFRKR